jgi:hypothetical protein
MRLIDLVAETLDREALPWALIGAGALAVHGVSRSTIDHDVLVTAPRVFHLDFWEALPDDVTFDARRGGDDDPLAGVVQLARPGDRVVDIMVGRPGWMDDVIDRRISVAIPGRDLAVVSLSDLILLKLYAGGVQDRWDVDQLLALGPTAAVREDVESRLNLLPAECGTLWHLLSDGHFRA